MYMFLHIGINFGFTTICPIIFRPSSVRFKISVCGPYFPIYGHDEQVNFGLVKQ